MVFVPIAHAVVVAGALAWRARDPRERAAVRVAALRAAGGFALSASLTFLLYAPVLPQMLAFFLRPGAGSTTAAVEWKSPLWLLNETLRGLGLGLALGWLGLAAGLALFAAGGIALLRRDPVFTLLIAVPPILGGLALLALGRNLWPRFFFHEAGFAALVAAAGARALGGRRLGTAFAVALVVASAVTLPRALALPKQDYRGARDFVRAEQEAGDRVVALDVAGEVYGRYYAPDWVHAKDGAALDAARAAEGRTWVVYTLPRYLAATQPALMQQLEREYELVREFPGTVGDGVLVVRRSVAGRDDGGR
jgi:hypothetical protein